MANLKLLLVAAALVATCQSVKPPGFVERPPVHDESPPNYAFDYEVRDHDGGSQGHTEVRKGIFAVGGYYSRLPGEGASQRVAYYADDWGFHPVLVAYGGRGYATRLAFGDKAVATANAAATGAFSNEASIKSIGVHVPETVNPLPDLTQTGAAALAAENPQKADADHLLATVGQPPAPPQPPKQFQAFGVTPVGNTRFSAPQIHSVAASSVVYNPTKIETNRLPNTASHVTPVHTSGSLPLSPAVSHVAPIASVHYNPATFTHSAPAISTGSLSPAISTNVVPIASHISPQIGVAIHPATEKTTISLHPASPNHVAPLLAVHGVPATATSYVSPAISTYTAPAVTAHVASAVATGHVAPVETTFIAQAEPTYTAHANVALEGSSYDVSSVNKYVSRVNAISKPTPQSFFFSTTPTPGTILEEGVHEIKSENRGVIQEVSGPAISYVSSSPATITKESGGIETSTVAPSVYNYEKNNIKESSAAAAAAAASALAAAAATEVGGNFNFQESGIQTEQESFYSKSSQNEGAAASFSSSSFSSSSDANEAVQEIEGHIQQEYNQNGGYSYERPANGLTYSPQVQTTTGIQSGGEIDQNYQYRAPVATGNYHNIGLFYNTEVRPLYQPRPQFAFNGGSSSSQFSSSQSTSSLSTSAINSAGIGGSSFGSQEFISSQPQLATGFQSHLHQNQPYPSFSKIETTGNGYQGVGLQLGSVDLEEQRRVVTTQTPPVGIEEEYDFSKLNRPIVVAELSNGQNLPQVIQETFTYAPPTPNPTFAPELSFTTPTSSIQGAIEVTTPRPTPSSKPLPFYFPSYPGKPGCRSCQFINSLQSSSSSNPEDIEVTTQNPTPSSESLPSFFPAYPGKPGCISCQNTGSQSYSTSSYPEDITETTQSPTPSSESLPSFFPAYPDKPGCRSCQNTGSQSSSTSSYPEDIEVTTQSPTPSSESLPSFFPAYPGKPGCRSCQNSDSGSPTSSTPAPLEVTTTSPVEITTETPITSPEPITAFYSTFPANSICRSCQYTNSQAINLLTAPAPETTSSSTTLDEDLLQQVFFPTGTTAIESEDKDIETTQSIDVTPKPFSLEENVSSNPTKQPTVNVEVVDEGENSATTSSTSSFEDYSQSSGSRGEGFTLERDRQSFSSGAVAAGQFTSDTGNTGAQTFNGGNEEFSSGGGNQFYTGTSGGGNQIYTDTNGGVNQFYTETSSGGGQYYSGGDEASRLSQALINGGGQQAYSGVSASSGAEGYRVQNYKGGQVYSVTATSAPPVGGQRLAFAVSPSPPSVLYVDRPVAVPVPYAVPQYVPYVKGSSYRERNNHRTSSSSSSSSDSFDTSTPSVISVTQITKIRTSGRKTSDRGYVKQIVEDESSASASEDEEEDDGEEVVIKGGSVKVRPGNLRHQQAYFRATPRPVLFRPVAEVGANGRRLQYGDRIRVERPRKLCIEYGGFNAPLVHSHPDYSQSINLR